MPSLADVDITEIEEIWHQTFTIDVRGEEEDHKFHYFGSDLISVYGQDLTGLEMQEAMNDIMINNTMGFYEDVLKTGQPQSQSSEFFMNDKEVRYRSIILPLSSNGVEIDFVFGTSNYKIFD
mgnify:CR=1 FL=1